MSYQVSVIIPIYNVEKFIERCAISLLEQSLVEVEFIFVDDCSPDNSISILRRVINQYPERLQSVKILKHLENKGLPSARNTGLAKATGEFVFHCDSDDYVEKDALELLVKKAKISGADIVWCDWYLSFENNERYMSQHVDNMDNTSNLSALKLLLGGGLKYNVWNKLVRLELYKKNNISFPDGNSMGEDMTMIKLFAHANTIEYLPKALYHYVQLNVDALTKKNTDNYLFQIQYNVEDLISYIENMFGSSLEDYIHFFKLNVKFPFLISLDYSSYERWNLWFKESNDYISKNPMFNFRSRFIQKMALNRQYWVLKIYNVILLKIIYGWVYR